MTPIQEAYILMQGQTEDNIRLIVELLRAMSPYKEKKEERMDSKSFQRTGLAKGMVQLPEDFDECFDDLDKEISELFYGDTI